MNSPLHEIKGVPHLFKIEAEKWGELSRFESHVYVRNLFATNRNYVANPSSYKSEPIFEMELDINATINDGTLGIDWFAYPCHIKFLSYDCNACH